MPMYDYECEYCGSTFEDMRSISDRKTTPCECGETATLRVRQAAILDPRMGVSTAFPSMAAKWEKKQRGKMLGKIKDSNNTRFGTNSDLERDAYNLRKKYEG